MGFGRSAKVSPETAAPAVRGKKQKRPAAESSASPTEPQAAGAVLPKSFEAEPMTLMLLGCDGAGKTTLASALAGKPLTEPPKATSGFQNMVGRQPGSPAAELTVFDVGGSAGVRGIWGEYYAAAHGAIFICDASDGERFAEAAALLRSVYADEAMLGKPLLVLASKQDLPHAVGAAELADALRVHELEGVGAAVQVGGGVLAGTGTLSGFSGTELEHALGWLLRAVRAAGSPLRERVTRQVAAQEEKEKQAKEARKKRLAAKRAAREAAEAAEAAEAKAKLEADAAAQATPPASPPPSPPLTMACVTTTRL